MKASICVLFTETISKALKYETPNKLHQVITKELFVSFSL